MRIIRNNPLRQRLTRIVRYLPPEAPPPQTGDGLTAASMIPGLPAQFDTPLEIINQLQANLNRLNSIDANNNGRADTADNLVNHTTNYSSQFLTGLL